MLLNGVYGLERQSVMSVFSTGFVNYHAPLTFSLVSSPPSPLPCVNKYTVYTFIVCKGGSMRSYEGRGPQPDKTPAAKSLYK